MFIDYVTLMLINMTAGLVMLAFFVCCGIHKPDCRAWSPAFGIVGLVATVCGFVMIFTWPLPYPYNIAFGEMSVLFGMLYLATALALSRSWSLMPLTVYAFIAGAAAIFVGVRMIHLGLTNKPMLSGIGFILTGAIGVLSPISVYLKNVIVIRLLGALLPIAAAAVWAMTCFSAYWAHLVPKQ